MTADRLAAEDLDALVGSDLWGCLDWREEREPVSPLQGDPCRCDRWDAQVMGDTDDIEAEARALAAKKAREREVEKRAEEILATEAAEQRQREVAANKAQNSTLGTVGMVVLGIGAIAIIVAAIASREGGTQPQAAVDNGCHDFTVRSMRIAKSMADGVCSCDGLECVRQAIEGSRHEMVLLERSRTEDGVCPEGLTPDDQRVVNAHLDRGQRCMDQWQGR